MCRRATITVCLTQVTAGLLQKTQAALVALPSSRMCRSRTIIDRLTQVTASLLQQTQAALMAIR